MESWIDSLTKSMTEKNTGTARQHRILLHTTVCWRHIRKKIPQQLYNSSQECYFLCTKLHNAASLDFHCCRIKSSPAAWCWILKSQCNANCCRHNGNKDSKALPLQCFLFLSTAETTVSTSCTLQQKNYCEHRAATDDKARQVSMANVRPAGCPTGDECSAQTSFLYLAKACSLTVVQTACCSNIQNSSSPAESPQVTLLSRTRATGK